MPTCEICGKECRTKGNLKQHKLYRHDPDPPEHVPKVDRNADIILRVVELKQKQSRVARALHMTRQRVHSIVEKWKLQRALEKRPELGDEES